MQRRTIIAGLAAAAVPWTALAPSASAAPTSTRSGTAITLPSRDQEVSAKRVREIAVAFHLVSADNLEAVLDKMVEAGVGRSQVVASWQAIAARPDENDWSVLDRYFRAAEERGISTLMHINSTPDWVHPDLVESVPNYGERIWYPPTRDVKELAAFERFVAELAGRYRGRVESYEIWNEENWRDFYRPIENPADYVKLLRTAYHAVKAADPDALVIFGGTTRSDPGFLRECYRAAETYPEARRSRHFFDVMGVHPYTDIRHPDDHDPAKVRDSPVGGEFDDNFLGIDRVYAELVRHGEGDKKIHLGEFSYSTGATWMGPVPDDRRAAYLRRAYELAAQRPYVSGLAWFLWSESAVEDEWRGWTLLEYPAEPTRSYQALTELTHGERMPGLRLDHRRGSVNATTTASVRGLTRAELYAEGRKVAEGATLPLAWRPTAEDSGRTPLLQLVLYTADGRTVTTEPRFLPIGPQRVQLSHPELKPGWNVDVSVGVQRGGPVTLRVLDSTDRTVHRLAFDTVGRPPNRLDALVSLDAPGTYRLVAVDSHGRPVAESATLTVR